VGQKSVNCSKQQHQDVLQISRAPVSSKELLAGVKKSFVS